MSYSKTIFAEKNFLVFITIPLQKHGFRKKPVFMPLFCWTAGDFDFNVKYSLHRVRLNTKPRPETFIRSV